MASLLLTNIAQLLAAYDSAPAVLRGKQMQNLPLIEQAYLLIEEDKIAAFGLMKDCELRADKEIDCSNRIVLPGFCDSHSHIVFAGDRSHELSLKNQGMDYQAIANAGGGILSTVKQVREVEEEELFDQSMQRLYDVISMGTLALEIKSGYGLDFDSELKMLRVIRRMKMESPIPIKATFLAAHAIPPEFTGNKEGYIQEIIEQMLPVVAKEGLADFIDVFCEQGYFTVTDTERILEAGSKRNLLGKVHVNQFNSIGGVQAAVDAKAISVDHLEEFTSVDLQAIRDSNTIAVGLPNCSLYLGIPYTPARLLIDENIAFALASDYNPGSSPSGNMQLVMALACIKMKLSTEEALLASTVNGAHAMSMAHTGSIALGQSANVIISKPIHSYRQFGYSFGANLVDHVIINGKTV